MARAPKNQQRAAQSKETAQLAVQLRARGLTLDQIAEQIGHKNKSSVSRLIDRELDRTPVEGADRLRKLELDTLARIQRKIDGLIDHKEPEISLEACRTQLSVSQQRAKLCGLNAPFRTELTGKDGAPLNDASKMSDEEIEKELEDLRRRAKA